jgi:hypothetical protein
MKERLTPEEFIRLARAVPVNERTPYAFEKRILARLGGGQIPDAITVWAQVLWRAVAPCVGIMLAAAALSLVTWTADPTPESEGPDLEQTVFAPTQVAFDLSR